MAENTVGGLGPLPVAVALVDDALGVIDCSHACLHLFGLDRSPTDAQEVARAFEDDADLGDELALATVRLVQAHDTETFEWRHGDRAFDVTVSRQPGMEPRFLVAFLDVTDTRRMEGIQREARSYLEQILADIPLGVAVLDEDLRLTFVNDAGRALCGRLGGPSELVELIGANLTDVISGEPGARWAELCRQARQQGGQVDGERERFDGDLVVEVSAHPLHDRRERALGAILVLEDVSDKARLEAEVRRMERLATVGQVAITVNHEINNPLTIITANAQAARLMNKDLDDKTVGRLQTIETQVRRIAEVTEKLRTMDEVESQDYIADGPQMIDIHGDARNAERR